MLSGELSDAVNMKLETGRYSRFGHTICAGSMYTTLQTSDHALNNLSNSYDGWDFLYTK